MQTARAAALLAAASSLDALAPLAAAAGVPGAPLPLGRRDRAALGLDDALTEARVAAGPGALRALLGTARPDLPLRDAARVVASRLAHRSPLPLWLVVVAHPTGGVALAAWTPAATPNGLPRVAALLADPRRVLASDADTLAALAAASAVDPDTPGADTLVHARWVEALGRESLTRRFYRHLEQTVAALADSCTGAPATRAERAELALLYTSRLLFLAFLQSKGWLDGDRAFLTRSFDRAVAAGGDYHRRALLPLFFGTLNTPEPRRAPAARAFGRVPFLNGGLFAPAPLERRLRRARFGDAELGAVVGGLLARYRFTTREDAAAWSEAAVDPEMLGKAFESLMGARERRSTGAFYTPQPLVERVTGAALATALAHGPDAVASDAVHDALAGSRPPAITAARLRARLARLRLLDPACGSGAFLVHALERVAALLALCGDSRPLSTVRREVLTRSIFGVDINPTAVWLAELRLWLSVVIESDEADPRHVPPLPNLDHNVRVGDTLGASDGSALGLPAWGGLAMAGHARTTADSAPCWGGDPWSRSATPPSRAHDAARLATLRARYARATGPRKQAAADRLADEERRQAVLAAERSLARLRAARRDLVAAARDRDLFGGRRGLTASERDRLLELRVACRAAAARRRALLRGAALPFGFAWHFADAGAAGGFDAVLGNPPWVRPHALAVDERAWLRALYRACGQAAWREGARLANAGEGFAGQADLAAAFVERSLALAAPGGAVALLLPAKLWHSLAGGGLRRLLLDEAEVLELEDWSDAPASFDAAVYPSLLVVRRRAPADGHGLGTATVAVHRGAAAHRFPLPQHRLPLDASPGSPWLLLPAPARRAFDRLRAAGPPLAASGLARPTLGVKCGCNAAYLVRLADPRERDAPDGDVVRVRADGREGCVERALLRPVLRGESLARATARPVVGPADDEWIVWPHDPSGRPLAALPTHAARWLAPWRARLEARADARGRTPWWSLFRTGGADPSRPRVVWPDVARAARAAALPVGDPTVPLNSCYVAACADERDARALAALLASPVIAAWLGALAEPARGGYRRHLAWTVALLPVPPDWARARDVLAPLADSGADLAAVAAAYALPARDLEPLVGDAHAPATPDPSCAP